MRITIGAFLLSTLLTLSACAAKSKPECPYMKAHGKCPMAETKGCDKCGADKCAKCAKHEGCDKCEKGASCSDCADCQKNDCPHKDCKKCSSKADSNDGK